jgi:hypothetical protein
MNKSILALTVLAGFAAFAPSAQAGDYYGYGNYYSGSRRCVDDDGDLVRCRSYRSNLPSIPGVPGGVQRTVENLLGVAPARRSGCWKYSRSWGEWYRVSCDD